MRDAIKIFMRQHLVWISLLISLAAGIMMWAWWVCHDLPNPYGRPHIILWDIVSLALRGEGKEVSAGFLNLDKNPLVIAGAWLMRKLGDDWRSIVCVQLPFLAILLTATTLLALRLGGRRAGALAPWLVLFAPTTLGLAFQVDDLLPLQALVTTALALVAWSTANRWKWLSFAVWIPVFCAVKWTLWFTNGLLFLMSFSLAAVALLAGRRRDARGQGGDQPGETNRLSLACASLGFLLTLIVAYLAFPREYPMEDYTVKEAARFFSKSILAEPAAVIAYPFAWVFYMAGPLLAFLAIAATVFLLVRKTVRATPAMIWLYMPMILLTLITGKRNDYYIIASMPAAPILIALAAEEITRERLRKTAGAAVVIVLFLGWVMAMRPGAAVHKYLDTMRLFDGRLFPYLHGPRADPGWKSPGAERWIARECGARRLPVLFVVEPDKRPADLFDIWQADHGLRIGELVRGPIPGSPLCLAVAVSDIENPDRSLMTILERIKVSLDSSRVPADDPLRSRIVVLESGLYKYSYLGEVNHWALFVPRDEK